MVDQTHTQRGLIVSGYLLTQTLGEGAYGKVKLGVRRGGNDDRAENVAVKIMHRKHMKVRHAVAWLAGWLAAARRIGVRQACAESSVQHEFACAPRRRRAVRTHVQHPGTGTCNGPR